MCFNGGHTWTLGWFSSYHVDLPINSSFEWTGFLVGFAEKQSSSSSNKMIIRIRNTLDTYIHFNRMIGMNADTVEGGDMVLISSSEKTTDYVTTNLVSKLSLEEMTGGTFTITNGGVFGSMLSTPIINPPQSAILGMHNIVERPVVKDGQIVIRPIMYVALSYDHRIIDGRESVGFLVKVKQCLENPTLLLTAGTDPQKMLLGL